MDSITRQKPIPLTTQRRLEKFRRRLGDLRRETLLKNVDLCIEQMDEARVRADRRAYEWARLRRNALSDELDVRDGVLDERDVVVLLALFPDTGVPIRELHPGRRDADERTAEARDALAALSEGAR